tara:strand:+ start:1011 stop:2033 length:1023 start_codon:yes stop_codon:yes gene_type:complete
MKKTIIIAEAGVNHNGSFDLAKKLVESAASSGADYVKFQTFKTELNISKTAKKAKYQIINTKNKVETQFEMVKKLELSFDEFLKIKLFCDKLKIGFLSTGFDFESVDFLDSLGMDYFKVPSGDITNKPLLKHIASKKRSIILSTGMANMNEIEMALDILTKHGCEKKQITVLHCNTEYPTPFEDVNLKAMNSIGEFLGVNIGYSDHSLGISVPIAAVALGAKIIEKHFTLDKNLEGPDHKCSLNPDELKIMVSSIRNIEQSLLGTGIKEPSKSEKVNIDIARKSLHINTNLKQGETLKEEHIICLRPGDGISPMIIDQILGLKIKKDLNSFTKLKITDLI